MPCFTVVRTLYIDTDDSDFFKYEILSNGSEEVTKIAVYSRRSVQDSWIECDEISLDYLDVRESGFTYRPSKCIATAVNACQEHRKNR